MGDTEPTTPTTPAEGAAAPAAAEKAADTSAPKKKCDKKKKIIIGCAAGAAAVLGISGLVFASVMDNTNENIALSAISDVFSSHQKSVNGYIELSDVNDTKKNTFRNRQNPISHVRVDLSSDTNADNEAKTTATFTVTYDKKDYKLVLDSVIVKDHTIYVSISNLKDTVNKLFKEMMNDSTMFTYKSAMEIYEDMIDQVVGEIDGNWWKISVPEVVDSLDDKMLSSDKKQEIKDVYACVIDAADKASKDGGKFGKIYRDNAFVGIEKYEGDAKPSAEGDLYSMNLDADKFVNFANKMSEQVKTYGLEDCMSKIREVSDDDDDDDEVEKIEEKLKSADVKKAFEKINKYFVIVIKNGFFSHKLSGIYLNVEKDGTRATVDFKIDALKGKISAPENAKSVTELVEDVEKAVEDSQETSVCKYYKKHYPSLYDSYCDADTNKPKTSLQSV